MHPSTGCKVLQEVHNFVSLVRDEWWEAPQAPHLCAYRGCLRGLRMWKNVKSEIRAGSGAAPPLMRPPAGAHCRPGTEHGKCDGCMVSWLSPRLLVFSCTIPSSANEVEHVHRRACCKFLGGAQLRALLSRTVRHHKCFEMSAVAVEVFVRQETCLLESWMDYGTD